MIKMFFEKVKVLKMEEEILLQKAKEAIPERYQGFLMVLPMPKEIYKGSLKNEEIKKIGCYESNGTIYYPFNTPYFSVDGRVKWAVDEALEKKVEYKVYPPVFQEIAGRLVCVATVETARGVASGTAVVGLGGSGVDRTNPFENAETSAIGRALGFQGYGLVGTGIASAEELVTALAMEKAMDTHSDRKASSDTHSDRKASSAQVNYMEQMIKKISKALKVGSDDYTRTILEEFGVSSLSELTLENAKKAINKMKEVLANTKTAS